MPRISYGVSDRTDSKNLAKRHATRKGHFGPGEVADTESTSPSLVEKVPFKELTHSAHMNRETNVVENDSSNVLDCRQFIPSANTEMSRMPEKQKLSEHSTDHAQMAEVEALHNVPRKRRSNIPRDVTNILQEWFLDHRSHPFPTGDEKQMLCRRTGLQPTQVSLFTDYAEA